MTTLLTRLALSRPKLILALAGITVIAFGFISIGVEKRMMPTQLFIKGENGTYQAHQLAEGHYGDPLLMQLRGPEGEVEKQGKALSKALANRPRTRILSPWSGSTAAHRLKPTKTDIALLIDLQRLPGETVSSVLPPLRAFAEARVKPPVKLHMSGITEVGRQYNDTIVESIEQGELIALPVLVLVLLLVFRTPLAAGIPIVVALGTVLTGKGVIRLLTEFMDLDAVTLNMASMIGLALGVDYSLLLVSRFRESLEEGANSDEAANVAAATAGRTVAFAGFVLIALMLVILLLSPGSASVSTAVGSITVAVIGVLGALLVTPAILLLAGTRINAWSILPAKKNADHSRIGRLVGAVTKRPKLSLTVAGGLCLLATLPALGLKQIPPDPRQLPDDNQALEDFRALRSIGFGPEIAIMLHSKGKPLTDPKNMADVAKLQDRLSALPYVKFVTGPAQVGEQTNEVYKLGPQLRSVSKQVSSGKRQLARLSNGLARAEDGVNEVRGGLNAAASGSSQIQDGTGKAVAGSGQLSDGIDRADAGGSQLADGTSQASKQIAELSAGLRRASAGSQALVQGSKDALAGSRALQKGTDQLTEALATQILPGATELATGLRSGSRDIERLKEPVDVIATQATAALNGLNNMTVGKVDPQYFETYKAVATIVGASSGRNPINGQPVADGYDGLPSAIDTTVNKTKQAADGADRLVDGIKQAADGGAKLSRGSAELRAGMSKLAEGQRRINDGLLEISSRVQASAPDLKRLQDGAAALSTGMGQLKRGARQLRTGLQQLSNAQGQLTEGLKDGSLRSRALSTGLGEAGDGVDEFGKKLSSGTSGLGQLDELSKRSPDFFESGYLAAAAASGAPKTQRETSELMVDTASGATTGRILLLPNLPTNDPRTTALVESVRDAAAKWQQGKPVAAVVGGGASQLSDFAAITKASVPWVIMGMCVVTFIMLVVVLRAVLLPILAVLLNMLTLGVAMGVLTILFTGENPILGGAGSLDVLMVSAIFAVTFALSIDYQVFLLSRMREGYVKTGSNAGAIDFGVRRTATVVTSAAAIMVSVFAAFAFAEFVAVKQLGIGLAVAVLVDATIIRLVLLPAAMSAMGEATWWIPDWLDKHLPHVDVEGTDL